MFSHVPPPRDPNAVSRGISRFLLGVGRVAVGAWAVVLAGAAAMVASGHPLSAESATAALLIHGCLSLSSPYLLLPVASQLLVTHDGDDLWVQTVLGRRRVPRPVAVVRWMWFPNARVSSWDMGAVMLRSGWRWVIVASLGDRDDVDSRLGWVVDQAVKVAGPGAARPRRADGSVWDTDWVTSDMGMLGFIFLVFTVPIACAAALFGW
jgi:hypothetical protein